MRLERRRERSTYDEKEGSGISFPPCWILVICETEVKLKLKLKMKMKMGLSGH